MVTEKTRKPLPPYVSYRSFRTFIDGLQTGVPARIDRSYWGERFSGSTGIQLMTTLRFLGLVDDTGMPSTRLRALVSARGTQRADSLRQIANSSYDFLSARTLDPQIATYAQLEDAFHNTYQVSGDVARKCIKFFTSLESDAGIPLSNFIIKKSKSTHANSAGRKKSTIKTDGRTKQNLQIPTGIQEIPSKNPWYEMVLAKFPTFDPAWSDEVKLKWFDAFDNLLKKPVS